MTEEVEYSVEYELLPIHMRESVYEYINMGRPAGSFLQAVIANNLKEAYQNADNINIHVIGGYVNFFYNHAPLDCWGSADQYMAWRKAGGLSGNKRPEETKDDG